MLFIHNNKYLPLTGLLPEIFEIFHEIFQGKKFHEILHHYSRNAN